MRTMRPSADAGDTDGFDAFARALQSTFPAGNDASLALLRLLSEGRPVTPAALAQAANRTAGEVVGRLSSWPNVEQTKRAKSWRSPASPFARRRTASGWAPDGSTRGAHRTRCSCPPCCPDRGRPLPLPGHWLRRRVRRRPGRGHERSPRSPARVVPVAGGHGHRRHHLLVLLPRRRRVRGARRAPRTRSSTWSRRSSSAAAWWRRCSNLVPQRSWR